jgi:hypothetical protein
MHLSVTSNTVGLIHMSLILFKGSQAFQPLGMAGMVSMLYVTVKGVDGAIAYPVSIAYDRIGTRFLHIHL